MKIANARHIANAETTADGNETNLATTGAGASSTADARKLPKSTTATSFARRAVAFAASTALCVVCFATTSCGNSESSDADADTSGETLEVSDSSETASEFNPAGAYHFDSISIDDGENVTAASLGADWNGTVLDADYASLAVNDDGTLAVAGAVEATGQWLLMGDGSLTIALDGVDYCGYSASSDGYFSIDINTDEGIVTYGFHK